MNYIQHLNTVFNQFYKDQRLHPGHISLYMALFQCWNRSHFSEVFHIQRKELMPLSGIRSTSTYNRCLKDLYQWRYLEYYPSTNPHQGSQVKMFSFSDDTVPPEGRYRPSTERYRPIIEHYQPNSGPHRLHSERYQPIKERYRPHSERYTLYNKTIKHINPIGENSQPINEQVIRDFFKQKDWPKTEAQKFFCHYESTGWKISGQPIADWKAAAQKWMLTADEIKKTSGRLAQQDYLKTEKEKNYAQPL